MDVTLSTPAHPSLTRAHSTLIRRHGRWIAVAAMLLLATMTRASASSGVHLFSRSDADWISGRGNQLFLIGGTFLPLFEDRHNGRNHTLRTIDSLAASLGVTEVLKYAVQEQRPGGGNHDSFPSGHATAAFAVATMQSTFHPAQAPFWYFGATVISISRLEAHDHFWWDVVAGAGIGYGMARWEWTRPHGLILFPFIEPDHHAAGVQMFAWF